MQKITLAVGGNVVVPALLALESRGFGVDRKVAKEGSETWHAENDRARLVADDVLSLLALAALVESRGARWQASDRQIEDYLRYFYDAS